MQRDYVVLCMGFHGAWYCCNLSGGFATIPCFHWRGCNNTLFPWKYHLEACVMCLCVIPPFLVFLAITIHCFYWRITIHCIVHLDPGKKTMDVVVYSKKSQWKNLYWLQYPVFNKVICKWLANLFFARDVPTRDLWLPWCNMSQWCRRNKKWHHCRWYEIRFLIMSQFFRSSTGL